MRLVASIEPEYLELIKRHMPNDESSAGMFKLDPELENALAEQNASVMSGQMGGENTYQAAVPVMMKVQMLKDFLGQKTQPGTLDDAYLRGVPGIAKPTTPGTVRPSDSNVDFMEIHTL